MKTRPLPSDHRALIRALRVEKGWRALRMMKEFHLRQLKRSTLNDLIKRIDETGSADRKMGTGRHRSVRTPDNIAVVDKLIGQFRKRLSLVVATGGGHIEHRFD